MHFHTLPLTPKIFQMPIGNIKKIPDSCQLWE
jgi:hypothetical protein